MALSKLQKTTAWDNQILELVESSRRVGHSFETFQAGIYLC